QIDPYYPTSAIGWLGTTYFLLGRLNEARDLLRQAVARSPKRAMFQYWLTAVCGHFADDNETSHQAAKLLALQPDFTISGPARPLAVFKEAQHVDLLIQSLRRSGLPE